MASTAAYNDKHVADMPTAVPVVANADIPYAIHAQQTTAAQYVVHPNAAPPATQYHHIHVAGPQVSTSAWETGLFECFCVPAHCCMAFFLPCISGAYAARAIGQSWVLAGTLIFIMFVGETVFSLLPSSDSGYSYQYSNYYHGESVDVLSGYNIVSLCFSLGFVFCVMWLRVLTRKYFNIPGSSIEDCCASFWCSCCALSQMSSHAEKVKNKSSANTLPAYHAA